MLVKDLMSRHLCSVRADTSLTEVARLMLKHDIGSLPVLRGDEAIGIITDRDIVCRSLAKGEDPCVHTAADCMTPSVISVKQDDELRLCLDLMEQYQVRRMLVLDNEGKLCGIVSQADVAREATSYDKAELLEKVSA